MIRHYSGIAVVNPITKTIERVVCHHDLDDSSPRLIPRIINENRIEVPIFFIESDAAILRKAFVNP